MILWRYRVAAQMRTRHLSPPRRSNIKLLLEKQINSDKTSSTRQLSNRSWKLLDQAGSLNHQQMSKHECGELKFVSRLNVLVSIASEPHFHLPPLPKCVQFVD